MAAPAPAGSNVTTMGADGSELIQHTRTQLVTMLREAADQATTNARTAATRERAAANAAAEAAHAADIERVRAEAVVHEQAAHAHGFHKAAWMFGLSAFAAGAALTLFGVSILQTTISSSATQSAQQGMLTGAATRSLQQAVTPIETCIPGGRRDDGSPCEGGTHRDR